MLNYKKIKVGKNYIEAILVKLQSKNPIVQGMPNKHALPIEAFV